MMTQNEAIELAAELGLEEDVDELISNGLSPEEALEEVGI